jgi:hypothetical protein
MDAFLIWPERPALSWLALWAISVVALWAARAPMFELIERLGKNLEELLEASGRWCRSAADALAERARSALLAAGGLELQARLEREFHRIEEGFSERLGQYSGLHRRLDDLLQTLEQDYQESGESPPEVPGWTAAVESIAGVPHADDPNVKTILEGVRQSLDEAQKKALHLYRADTAERHGILERMRSLWKEVTVLQERMRETVAGALETASRVNGLIDEYARVRDDDRAAARALSYSASKTFAIALLVVVVLSACGLISFHLLAVPLAALLEDATLLGVPLAALGAGLVVLAHVGLGVLALDLVGVTELLPRVAALAGARRRRLLQAALGGLLALAVCEGALAGLHEGYGLGEQMLGFVLPFVVALAAVPLDTLLDSGRHAGVALAAWWVGALGSLCFLAARCVRAVASVLPSLYDVYVSVPLRLERWLARPAAPRRLFARPATEPEASG